MAHNLSGRGTSQCETFSGVLTLTQPHDIPEGGSPRTVNTDFNVGSVFTRQGLENQFTYANGTTGPMGGANAVVISDNLSSWTNPNNVLFNTGVFATTNISSLTSANSANSIGSSIGGGVAWLNPTNINSNSNVATVALSGGSTNYSPIQSGGGVTATAYPAAPYNQQIATLSGFSSILTSSATLYVTLSGTITSSGRGSGSVQLLYSINNGITWTNQQIWLSSFSSTVVPISLTGLTNLNTVQIQLVATSDAQVLGYCTSSIGVTNWYATIPTAIGLTSQILSTVSNITIPSNSTITNLEISFKADYQYTAPTFEVGLNVGNITPSFSLTTSPNVYTSSGLWGYSDWEASTLENLSVNFYASANSNSTINVNDLNITVYYEVPGYNASDPLNITQFEFSLADTAIPQGFLITANANCSSSSNLSVQLMKNNVPVGVIETQPINVGNLSTITFGDTNDLFGTSWLYSDLNNTKFGLQLTASTDNDTANINVGYVSITPYFNLTNANFNYIGTYEDSFNDIYTVAMDSTGEIYLEDVNTNPNVLNSLMSGVPANSYATAFNLDSRMYMAISDGQAGNFYPIQIIGPSNAQTGWQDRISIEGPGIAPSFQGTLSTGSNVVNLVSYNGNANVVTFTANNSLTAGEVITFDVTAGPTYVNGKSFNVLGTGLSNSAFEINYSGASGSGNVTGNAIPQYTYPISSITQYPFWNASQGYQSGFDDILWSAGPGVTNAGTTITVYYLNAYDYQGGIDQNLQAAWNNKLFPVYVYVSGTNMAQANGTQLVTGIGIGTPPGGGNQRYYFTFTVPTSGYSNLGGGNNSQPGTYQLTIANLTTTLPLPGVSVGQSITVSNASISSWDQSFQIVNALNSGVYSISQTSMSNVGVATYNWSLAGNSNAAPQNGQLVTVNGTISSSNPPNTYNVTDAAIENVVGSSSGTFQISGFGATNVETAIQSGAQAVTSGTQFQIDPGPGTLGDLAADPIYGSSSGGFITLIGSSSVVLSQGVRRGTCFFITRNGYWSRPAPPVEFGTGADTNYIVVTNIPIGGPDVIARAIVFTEAGQNDQPGASYYTIPEPVQFVYNNVNYLSSSLIIWDNTTTQAQFTFSDPVLINANNQVDAPGQDLFALNYLSDAAWNAQYMGRSIYGRVNNKVNNFLGMTFGSYIDNPGSNLIPAGWSLDPSSNPSNSLPTLLNSPILNGLSYYINNQTGNTAPILNMIYQSAYQDWENVPILQNQTPYSVRVVCRTPSNANIGSLNVDLTTYNIGSGFGQTYGTFSLPLSDMTSYMKTYTGTLLTSNNLTIPDALQLRLYAANLGANADIEIDSLEIYPTIDPVNLTELTVSYTNDLESFDGDTGGIDTTTTNQQPANGAITILNKLYILKESSMGYVDDTPNQEPADWNPYKEISNVCGACGINAYDVGEEWLVTACQNGLFAFNGGAPIELQLEVPDIWKSINWTYGHTIVVRNDVANRRILVAVPMATPNQWCPTFPINSNPTQPNVIIMLNYAGIGSIEELINGMGMHVTIVGKIAVHDLKRKWSLWSIPTPYMAICKRDQLTAQMLIGNGINSSKIYNLGSYSSGEDDGVPFYSSYMTYGAISQEKAKEAPQFGILNKRFAYFDALLTGSGTANVAFYPNTLTSNAWSIPGGLQLTPNSFQDQAGALDLYGQRLFTEFSVNGNWFNLSRFTLAGQADTWRPING